jgi:hypothetical protein
MTYRFLKLKIQGPAAWIECGVPCQAAAKLGPTRTDLEDPLDPGGNYGQGQDEGVRRQGL